MTEQYEIRKIVWYNPRRLWAVFRGYGLLSTCLFTAATERQCRDWLRTMQHQRRIPKGGIQ